MFLSREELENIQQSLADGEADERSYSLSSLQVWHGPPCHSELADLVMCVREARLLQLRVPWPRATGLPQLLAPQPTGLRPRAHSSCWCLGQYTHVRSLLFFHACSLNCLSPSSLSLAGPLHPRRNLVQSQDVFPYMFL